MVLNETPAPTVRHHNRGTAAVAALLVLFSLFVALGSIQRSELGVSGHGLVGSEIHVQWVVLVAGIITAVEGAVALMMLLGHKVGAARRALYVSAFTGLVGLVGTALSLIALALLHRQES